MSTPAELLVQSLAKLQSANRIDGTRASYRKDNPTEYQKVVAYLQGGARPSGVTSDMGLGLVLAEDARRGLQPSPTPTPTPGAYTNAASVDLSRNPVPPQGGTVVNLSSPLTISGTVTDTTYNITASMSVAVRVPAGARLERCVVNCNGLANYGVSGPGTGTVKDVLVTKASLYGFSNVKAYEGCCKTTACYRGFEIGGSGTTQLADCMMKSDDDNHFGIFCIDLSASNLAGALVALNCGATSGDEAATGIQWWSNVNTTAFNIMISNAHPGYGFCMAGATTANNTIKEIYCDGQGAGGDPAFSIQGGAHDNTIDKLTSIGYLVGCIMGEDVPPAPYNNRVKTMLARDAGYPGIILDRGAHNNVIGETGGATITNMGSTGEYLGAVHIANRSGQTETPPHHNQVLGLVQSGATIRPEHAVYFGPGTSGNIVSGSASSWSVSKVLDQGSGNTVGV